ncbi:hypothetical protein [Neobacillus mesonae]|nr:hypothetical protein [Neobacillus mesonae]
MKKISKFALGLIVLLTVTVNGQNLQTNYNMEVNAPLYDLPFEH